MANNTVTPIRPNTATFNTGALFNCNDFNAGVAAGSTVILNSESGGQSLAVNYFDFIGTYTLTMEDPKTIGGVDLASATTLKLNLAGALVVTFQDMFGGAAMTCTGTLSRMSGCTFGASRSAPGTSSITGHTLFGASGEQPFTWA